MKRIDINKMAQIIKDVVSTTPGIVAFAHSRDSKGYQSTLVLEKDIIPALRIRKIKPNYYQITIHIISSIYTNLLQVLQEVQYTVKYELEKEMDLYNYFRVDICIQDLIE